MGNYEVGQHVNIKESAAFGSLTARQAFKENGYVGIIEIASPDLYLVTPVVNPTDLTDFFYEGEIVGEAVHWIGQRVRVSNLAVFLTPREHEAFKIAGYIGTISAMGIPSQGKHIICVEVSGDVTDWFTPYEIVEVLPDHVQETNPVIASVMGLYERFGLKLDINNTYGIYDEEVKEFHRASRNLRALINGFHHDHTVRSAAANEFADVIYTLTGHALALGLTPEELTAAVTAVVEKNNGKNHLTHEVVYDPQTDMAKITRRRLHILAVSITDAERYADSRPFHYIESLRDARGIVGEVVIIGFNSGRRGWYDKLKEACQYLRDKVQRGEVVITYVD